MITQTSKTVTNQLQRARKAYVRDFEKTGLPLETFHDYALFRDIRLLEKIEAQTRSRTAGPFLSALPGHLSPIYRKTAQLAIRLQVKSVPGFNPPLFYLRQFDPYAMTVPFNDTRQQFEWILAQPLSLEVLFAFKSLTNFNFLYVHNLLHAVLNAVFEPSKNANALDYAVFIESLVCITEEYAVQQMGSVLYDVLRRFGLFFDFGEIEKTSLYDRNFQMRVLKQLRHRHHTPSTYAVEWARSYGNPSYPFAKMRRRRTAARLQPLKVGDCALETFEESGENFFAEVSARLQNLLAVPIVRRDSQTQHLSQND